MLRRLSISKGTSILALFSVPIALVLLSDNILSFIVPIAIENTVKSNLVTGLILGFSSLVGMFSDYIFPSILKDLSWKAQFLATIILALFFPIISAFGTIYSLVWVFIIISILWGIYYELLIFSEEDFMVEEEQQKDYSKDWSILMSLNVVTNIIGPIIASSFLLLAVWEYTFILVGLVVVAVIYTVIVFGVEIKDNSIHKPKKLKKHRLSADLFREFAMWKELAKETVPVLILYFMLSWIDMTFFVLGGIFGVELQGEGGMEWIVVLLYNIPTILVSFIVVKSNIRHRKKFWGTIALLLGCSLFSLMAFAQNSKVLVIAIILSGSVAIAFAWPLSKAVLSDISKRADKYGTHVMGLYNAVGSFACFISPIIMGYIADQIGYYKMFSIMGVIGVVLATYLLITTPKKLKLNHQQLDKIDASFKL
jgi:MFS family permease